MDDTNKTSKPRKLFLLFAFVCISIILIVFAISKLTSNNSKNTFEDKKPTITISPTKETEKSLEENINEESEDLILNFKDTQVAFFGYPYTAKPYYPKLFTLVFINQVENDKQWLEQYLPDAEKWEGSYQSSKAESKIYFAVSKNPDGKPGVWQSMEIINKSELQGKLPDCTPSTYLLNDLKLTAYECSGSQSFSASMPCFIEVEAEKGILYLQHSSDPEVKTNLCDVLKANQITAVEFGKYY